MQCVASLGFVVAGPLCPLPPGLARRGPERGTGSASTLPVGTAGEVRCETREDLGFLPPSPAEHLNSDRS
jgi:hypothetical protein